MLEAFYTAATKFNKEFGIVPVVIIDNANRLARELLDTLQDHAKRAADDSTVTFVFVALEGTVSHRMIGTLNCC